MTPQASELRKLIERDLQRDIRNQAMIDGWNMAAQSCPPHGRHWNWPAVIGLALTFLFWIVAGRLFFG